MLPFLLVCVTHRPRNSFGSFSPLSVSPPLIPIITFLFYDSFSFSAWIILLSMSSFPPASHYVSMLPFCLSNRILSFFLSSGFCSIVSFFFPPPRFLILFSQHDLIGHILIITHHPSHRSLNGISPTTISPCSHSSFPSPLSLSR